MRVHRLVGKIALGASLVMAAAEAMAGCALGTGALHPQRSPLLPNSIARADAVFSRLGASRHDFEVRAADGTILRGWKVGAAQPVGDWVLLFHGVADNRLGTLQYAGFLLRRGYSVVMMDARAHGASDGSQATYGWRERDDTRGVVEALVAAEHPHCIFELGESMGAAIALQSATIEPKIDGVVAESSFRNLREVTYDYTGLHWSPFLGKTLFLPASLAAIPQMEKAGGFHAKDISPEHSVAMRAFPVLLICDGNDKTIPCRHSKAIYAAAKGPKQLWVVPGAGHTGAYGTSPDEFERRVTTFFAGVHAEKHN
jgi:alpha-beta hydrolase superfamily lysophospholipase